MFAIATAIETNSSLSEQPDTKLMVLFGQSCYATVSWAEAGGLQHLIVELQHANRCESSQLAVERTSMTLYINMRWYQASKYGTC